MRRRRPNRVLTVVKSTGDRGEGRLGVLTDVGDGDVGVVGVVAVQFLHGSPLHGVR